MPKDKEIIVLKGRCLDHVTDLKFGIPRIYLEN